MDFLSVILDSFLAGDAVKALAKKTGISSGTLKKFLPVAVPFLVNMLTKNASSKEGASSLLEALSQHTDSTPVSEQIENADLIDGSKILGHIFGSGSEKELKALSGESKLSETAVSGILSSIAPTLLSALSAAVKSGKSGKRSKDGGFDLSGLLSMLGGSRKSGVGKLLSGLFGGKKTRKTKDDSFNGITLLSYLLGLG